MGSLKPQETEGQPLDGQVVEGPCATHLRLAGWRGLIQPGRDLLKVRAHQPQALPGSRLPTKSCLLGDDGI